MEFSTREDIEAPIDFVFSQVTDFPAFERSIMRRGGDVERMEGDATPAVGTRWNVKFMMRGAERQVKATVTELDTPSLMNIGLMSKNIEGDMRIELVPLSKARTRLNVRFEATAKTIPAKLLFQSIRFARQRSNTRFKTVVQGFAEDVEARYRA